MLPAAQIQASPPRPHGHVSNTPGAMPPQDTDADRHQLPHACLALPFADETRSTRIVQDRLAAIGPALPNMPPLLRAAAQEDLPSLEAALRAGADVKQRHLAGAREYDAMGLAVLLDRKQAARALRRAGAPLERKLEEAIELDCAAGIELLVSRFGLPMNAKKAAPRPLDYAITHRSLRAAQALLNLGACFEYRSRSRDAPDTSPLTATPLEAAVRQGWPPMVRLLLNYGAPMTQAALSAAEPDHFSVDPAPRAEIGRCLLRQIADDGLKLHFALMYGEIAIAEPMLRYGLRPLDPTPGPLRRLLPLGPGRSTGGYLQAGTNANCFDMIQLVLQYGLYRSRIELLDATLQTEHDAVRRLLRRQLERAYEAKPPSVWAWRTDTA